jgi:tetratricopeptide (TPR) repeat protein
LISLCRDIYQGNPIELSIIDEFERNYRTNEALWWYTRDSFISRLLNKALQAQTIDLLYLLRFFLQDLREQLQLKQPSSSIRVYREEFLSNEHLELLKKSVGDFISLNSFLSTNLNCQRVLKNCTDSDQSKNVLFEITADPSSSGIKPFGLTDQDNEILFMVGSIFCINDVIEQSEQLSIIRMTLFSDNDPQLKMIFKSLKPEINDGEINLLAYGDILWKIGKFNDAEKYYQRLLTELSADDYHQISGCYYALGNLAMEKNDDNIGFEWHQKSLEIKKKILQENDPSIADSYNSLADIERKKGNSVQAMEFYNKALEIWTKAYDNDHVKIAMCWNNIGCIYGEEKNFRKTLEYEEKALQMMQKHFPSDHLCLGQAYNNIGTVYRYLGNYELALEHYRKSIEIKSKAFSWKHPSVASTYSNMANVYEDMNSFKKALEYYEKAGSIYRLRFPKTHPENLRIAEDIQRISSKLKQ